MGQSEYDKKTWRGDSAICGTLCVCQGLAVLSAVSIIYLTVIVYLPAKRELESGIGESPVMCTTKQRRQSDDPQTCSLGSSCTEWCLGKAGGGGPCDEVHVQVRQNGTDAVFQGCKLVHRKQCSVLDSLTNNQFSCKKDIQCTELDGTFLCKDGLCTNISQVYQCAWEVEDEEEPLNCYYKRNCVTLDGEYVCRAGQCSRLSRGWSCRRLCEEIPLAGRNLMLLAGENIIAAHCTTAVDARNGLEMWASSVTEPDVLLVASCTTFHQSADMIEVSDCINGSLIKRDLFGDYSNLTTITQVYQDNGLAGRFDHNNELSEKRKTFLPFDYEITIYNNTVMYINHEGCVNTLQGECKDFYDKHGRDGRNDTSPSRFPCYYAPDNADFVVSRYDLIRTKWMFLVFFSVPAVILLSSCSMLFICSRVVGITSSGAMAMMMGLWKTASQGDMKRTASHSDMKRTKSHSDIAMKRLQQNEPEI